MIDVTSDQLLIINNLIEEFSPGCEIFVFGSRISGNPKSYSDLDLVIKGKQSISRSVMTNLRYAFEESDLPFRVDILDWHTLSESFRKMIMSNCRVLSAESSGVDQQNN